MSDLGVNEIELHAKFWHRCEQHLSEHSLRPFNMDVTVERTAYGFMVVLGTLFLTAHDHETKETFDCGPETWWDHFKERWYPLWALQRWPAKRIERRYTVEYTRCCPHIDVKIPGGQKTHLAWLTKMPKLDATHE